MSASTGLRMAPEEALDRLRRLRGGRRHSGYAHACAWRRGSDDGRSELPSMRRWPRPGLKETSVGHDEIRGRFHGLLDAGWLWQWRDQPVETSANFVPNS